jgi:hypothetical protein
MAARSSFFISGFFMPFNKTRKRVRAQTYSVIAVTVSFVAVALVLTGLMARVVATMTLAANEIDDARATHMTQTVVAEFSERLRATVKDKAIRDDAYAAMDSTGATGSADENWGKTSENYSLYDGAIVIGLMVALCPLMRTGSHSFRMSISGMPSNGRSKPPQARDRNHSSIFSRQRTV